MFKMILAFLFVFVLFFFGINAVREMTGKERWKITKLLSYSVLCALLTVIALFGIVITF